MDRTVQDDHGQDAPSSGSRFQPMMTRAEAATPESSDMNASAQAEEASGETGFPRCELDRSTSFLEYLTLSWISPLLSIGALRPLTEVAVF